MNDALMRLDAQTLQAARDEGKIPDPLWQRIVISSNDMVQVREFYALGLGMKCSSFCNVSGAVGYAR